MPKNVVICCDGTGNEVNENISNVLKLFRIAEKSDRQVVFYDPGVGTISSGDAWARMRNGAYRVFALATGHGIDANVLDAYRFLVDTFEEGDDVFLFGFSRGAYTIRVLAGFLRMVGLVERPQRNLCEYALTAYKKAARQDEFEIAWRFERVIATRRVPIRFIGVWDTVSSIFVPRPDRFHIPSLQHLPYTKTNSYVRTFRHALAIDERRRMFRPDIWTDPQEYRPNPFSKGPAPMQDIRQVWFAGFHSDVGGGYPEEESGLAKFPLQWMLDEARANGLLLKKVTYDHLVLGRREGGSLRYVPPDVAGCAHDSMKWWWRIIDWLPGRRAIASGARVHQSVLERMRAVPAYRPANLPPTDELVVETGGSRTGP